MSSLASIDKFINSISCPCRAFGTHGVRSVKSSLLAASYERPFLAYVKANIDRVIGALEIVGSEARPSILECNAMHGRVLQA